MRFLLVHVHLYTPDEGSEALCSQDPSSAVRLGAQERGASSSACMASNALTATTASPPSAALAATSDRTACCSVSSAERAAWYRVGFCACSAARAMGPLHQLLARVSRKTTQLRGSMVDRAATTHWPTSSRSARTSRTDPAERPTGSRRSSPSRRRRTRLIVRRAEPIGQATCVSAGPRTQAMAIYVPRSRPARRGSLLSDPEHRVPLRLGHKLRQRWAG